MARPKIEKEPEEIGETEETTIPVTPDVNAIIIETYRGIVELNKKSNELLKIAKEE